MRYRIRLGIELIIAVVAILALIFISTARNTARVVGPVASIAPETVTKLGTLVCLPAKASPAPAGGQCAYGLRVDTGTYYALLDEKVKTPNFDNGQRVRVTGHFTAHATSNYQDVGVIVITTLVKLPPS